MYDCVVPGCKAKGVHNFPRNEQLRKLWEIAAKMSESKIYNPTKTCKICATHFKPDNYFKEGFYTGVKNKKRILKKNVIPSRFPWNTKKKSLLKKMGIIVEKKEKSSDNAESTEPKSSETIDVPPTSTISEQDKTIEKMVEDVSSAISAVSQNQNIEKMDESALITLEDIEDQGKTIVELQTVVPTVSAVSYIQDIISDKIENVATNSKIPQNQDQTITENQIFEAIQADTKQDKTQMRLNKQKKKQLLTLDHFKSDNIEILTRTGMESFEKLMAVFGTLGNEVYFLENRRNVISAEDQFFLTLIKLRQNKEDEQLAKLFSITPAVASNIFITWVDFLYEKWKLVKLSPERVEILVSPEDYLSQLDRNADGQKESNSTDKKGKKADKGKSKKEMKRKEILAKIHAVPEKIPEGVSKTFTIMLSTENIKHKFSCSTSTDAEFSLKQSDCEWEALQLQTATPHTHTTSTKSSWRRAVGSQWRPQSGCHYHCIAGGVGVRLVRASTPTTTIQLCRDTARNELGCTQRKSPYQYATMVCSKYKERVRRLSGLGMQISPVLEDPDRPCRIACQDERVPHRFYLVNGQEGWFPLGTACGKRNSSYCVSGKCLEFGPDNTPLSESVFTLPLLSRYNTSVSRSSRQRRSARPHSRSAQPHPRSAQPHPLSAQPHSHSAQPHPHSARPHPRARRTLSRDRVTVKATLHDQHLNDIIARLNLTNKVNEHILVTYLDSIPEHIEVDFSNPIHIAPEDTLIRKTHRPTWD